MKRRARDARGTVPVLALMGALAVFHSSCALSKPPSHAELLNDALPPNTIVPATWAAGGNANDVAGDWLRTFNDRGLDAIVAEAIANNLDLREAAQRVEIARQTVVVVGAQMKPQIGADLGLRTMRDADHDAWYNSTVALAGVAWEPDVWGKLRAQESAAEAGFEATALDYSFARQSLTATTARSWYLATESNQLVTLAERSVAIYAQLLGLVKIRRTSGRVGDLDVAEASGNLNTAESQLRAAQGLASEARRNLEVLIGRYPSAELKVAETFVPVPPAIEAGLPSSLLERRPDLVAAEKKVLVAFRQQEAAKLTLLPSFSLGLSGGRLGDSLLSVLQVNPWMMTAALGMRIPIYTGGALEAQVEIASAEELRAVAAYGSAALRAFREVENGLMNESLLTQRLEFAEGALRDNIEAVRIAMVQYKAGSMDLLSVLQLQEIEIRTQADVIQLRNAQLANRINLHLALGGSFDSEPAVVSLRTSGGS